MGTGGLRGPALVRAAPLAVLAAAVLAVAGCGSTDFPNDPRPPTPIDATARVSNRSVLVSPNDFGAGLVDFTVSNQSDNPITFTVNGPVSASSELIDAGGVGTVKVAMKEGRYRATAGADSTASPDQIKVGPERHSAQNQLLLP